MPQTLTRRQFVQTSTAGLASPPHAPLFGQAPAVQTGGQAGRRISSANGNATRTAAP